MLGTVRIRTFRLGGPVVVRLLGGMLLTVVKLIMCLFIGNPLLILFWT